MRQNALLIKINNFFVNNENLGHRFGDTVGGHKPMIFIPNFPWPCVGQLNTTEGIFSN